MSIQASSTSLEEIFIAPILGSTDAVAQDSTPSFHPGVEAILRPDSDQKILHLLHTRRIFVNEVSVFVFSDYRLKVYF